MDMWRHSVHRINDFGKKLVSLSKKEFWREDICRGDDNAPDILVRLHKYTTMSGRVYYESVEEYNQDEYSGYGFKEKYYPTPKPILRFGGSLGGVSSF